MKKGNIGAAQASWEEYGLNIIATGDCNGRDAKLHTFRRLEYEIRNSVQ